MPLQLALLLLATFVSVLIYGALLVTLAFRHRWRDTTERQFTYYVALALLTHLALSAAYGLESVGSDSFLALKIHLYFQAALPLFFYAFANAFAFALVGNPRAGVEQSPWIFITGLVLLAALIGVDLAQLAIYFGDTVLSPASVVLLLRATLWVASIALVVLIGVIANRRTSSPLHRNRLAYLVIALPFLAAYDAFDLTRGESARVLGIASQVIGILILGYAVLQHHLADLRYLLRQATAQLLIMVFAIAAYFFVIKVTFDAAQDQEAWVVSGSVLVAAMLLTLIYQPLRMWLEWVIQRLLFGRRYNVQQVVQTFSQRLNARIDLIQLAEEGRDLLKTTMGARDAALLVVSRDKADMVLHPLPAQPDWPPEVRVEGFVPMINALVTRPAPLLQYDIDRLPEFADIAPDARTILRKFRTEVYVPILSHGALIGVWMVGAKVSDDRYTDTDLALLATLADQSAVALENARLLSDLRDQVLQVRSMRDYLDSTLASIVTGVLTLNREGTIVSFNRAAEEIFQVPATSAIGQHYERVLPPLESVQFSRLLVRAGAQSASQVMRDMVTRVAGRGEVHLTIHLSSIRRGDEMVGVALVVEDLTEQVRLEEETRRVRTTFERYVAPTVVEGVLSDPSRTALGGDRQPVTIVFADLHGFTRLSEYLPPEELVEILNGYLSVAAQVIVRYEGTLDKFMGDAVMAIFNAPVVQPDHAWRAALAALALQRNTADYARQLPEQQRLAFRIGVHTGEAVVGNVGTRELINYTAIGDTVNVAKRLQENADNNQILLSRSTYLLVEDRAVVQPRETLIVKGRETPVEVFELIGAWEQP
ncbi:adenylate cyclase [Anaerolineae bacterium]|nr:adenylate cyclase [Anaerolineae bacterium]